jgi:hypothetical protein
MWKSEWDYNPETDKLPRNVTIIIVIASIVAAVYLSMILV